jgi:mono/diheme cytochrome c family protein
MKSAFLLCASVALLLAGGAVGQTPAKPSAGVDQGKRIFVSRCAKCHDDNGSKKLPDDTTLLLRLSRSADPEARLATRLKNPDERRQVFLYLKPFIAGAASNGKGNR